MQKTGCIKIAVVDQLEKNVLQNYFTFDGYLEKYWVLRKKILFS